MPAYGAADESARRRRRSRRRPSRRRSRPSSSSASATPASVAPTISVRSRVRLAVALALEREQAGLEADAAAAEQDQQRGDRRRGEDRQRHVLEVGEPRERERRREDAGGRGGDDAHRFFDRRVTPHRSVETHDLVDEQLRDDRDQQVRDEPAHAERRVARRSRARNARSQAAPITPKSRTRRLVVPRPWATPYTERASRCGSEGAFGPSLSGAVENRPTPVPPPPPAQPGLEPDPSGLPPKSWRGLRRASTGRNALPRGVSWLLMRGM